VIIRQLIHQPVFCVVLLKDLDIDNTELLLLSINLI